MSLFFSLVVIFQIVLQQDTKLHQVSRKISRQAGIR